MASLETFLITGVSRGLGAGFFGELTSVRPHAMIVAVWRSFSEAQVAAAAHEPDSIKLIHADLSQTPDWRDLHFVGQLTGKLTVILNAGIVAPIGVVGTVDYSDLQRCHHINFLSQANFLINSRILDCLNKYDPNDSLNFTKKTTELQKLLSPAEMGDLFKVMVLSKNIDIDLGCSQTQDKSFQL